MHAVLALGATHYSLITPHDPQYKVMAISHRGKALEKVSRALENIDTCSASSLDAILATCYALTFQAYYMNDGMIDFAVMVRGCSLITGHIQRRFKSSKMFLLQTKEEVLQLVEPWLSEAPHPNREALSLCIRDIEELHPFLVDKNARGFFNAIHKTYVTLQASIRDTFECLSEVYSIWYSMGNEDFNSFISSENTICRALFLHYLAIETLMRPFLLEIRGPKHPTLSFGAVVIQQWADAAYESLPPSMQVLVKYEVDLISLEK